MHHCHFQTEGKDVSGAEGISRGLSYVAIAKTIGCVTSTVPLEVVRK